MTKRLSLACAVLAAALVGAVSAMADETVSISGSRAVLIKPKGPKASLVLVPGDNGSISAGENGEINGLKDNQLVRTRHAYAASGFAVLVTDATINLSNAIRYMAAIKQPVAVVTISQGTQRVAQGIAQGAKPDALVLLSGMLSRNSGSGYNVMSILGSPVALPRTLIIHHQLDSCPMTLPAGVEPFVKWSGGRARVYWVDGGINEGHPCEALAYHGFNGLDSAIVGVVAGFM